MNVVVRTRRTAAIGIAALLGAGALIATAQAGPASAAAEWNDYSSTLPAFITGPTPFEVLVDGPDPVCSMTFNGTTVTAAPWAFTMPITNDRYYYDSVDITLCDGESDFASLKTTPAFTFRSPVQALDGGSAQRNPVTVTNNMDVPATVTVTDKQGKQISTQSADPGQDAQVAIPAKGVKSTTTYRVTATGANGLQMSDTVLLAKGWSPMTETGAIFRPCSTVPWSYSAQGQPKVSKSMKAEIARGLAHLSKEVSLKFVYTPKAADALLTYAWKDMGKSGPAGIGGPHWTSSGNNSGHVDFNTRSWWVQDRYAGLGAWKGSGTGPGGRGWLVVHETMHALGFDHVDDTASIMNPINRGQHAFTKGDLQGLHALYPSSSCG
jgi:hypothetical protein